MDNRGFGRLEFLQVARILQDAKISYSAPFFSLFALLSFWDLICNDEFNSGSSCLN